MDISCSIAFFIHSPPYTVNQYIDITEKFPPLSHFHIEESSSTGEEAIASKVPLRLSICVLPSGFDLTILDKFHQFLCRTSLTSIFFWGPTHMQEEKVTVAKLLCTIYPYRMKHGHLCPIYTHTTPEYLLC